MNCTAMLTIKRNGKVIGCMTEPSGMQNAKRKNGKKLFRSQAGPQARPINPYIPVKRPTIEMRDCSTA